MQTDPKAILKELLPDYSEQQLEDARANVRAYLAVLLRMAERLSAEGRSIDDASEEI